MKKQQQHIVPGWTVWAAPLALIAMLLTPWKALVTQEPDAAFLLLTLLGIGNAIVVISITHWVKAALGGGRK